MFFSVIVPVYRVEKYLNECVDSVLVQTFNDFEVLLIDDGSPDNCGNICDEYASKDDRVKVIHKENGGLSDARNCGLKVATGEYVVFLDSDDKLFDSFVLEKLHSVLIEKNHPEALLTGESNLNKLEILDGKTYLKTLLKKGREQEKYDVTVWNKVYKTKYILDCELFFVKGFVHEDDNWTPKAIANAKSCIGIDLNICWHRVNDQSITKVKNEKSICNRSISKMHMAHDTLNYFKNFDCDEQLRFMTIEYALKMFFSGVSIGVGVKDKELKKIIKNKIKECKEMFTFTKVSSKFSHKLLSFIYKVFGASGVLFVIKNLK